MGQIKQLKERLKKETLSKELCESCSQAFSGLSKNVNIEEITEQHEEIASIIDKLNRLDSEKDSAIILDTLSALTTTLHKHTNENYVGQNFVNKLQQIKELVKTGFCGLTLQMIEKTTDFDDRWCLDSPKREDINKLVTCTKKSIASIDAIYENCVKQNVPPFNVDQKNILEEEITSLFGILVLSQEMHANAIENGSLDEIKIEIGSSSTIYDDAAQLIFLSNDREGARKWAIGHLEEAQNAIPRILADIKKAADKISMTEPKALD